ncbi:TRAP transporter large permease subunit [Shouchella shacheensis]|uniref:TRAP transporter large permease subunit n=1 Tax=Shouchella shacheensis TaxID=1649580 RepID=UPI00073FEAC4|nr:TRAP transporter large permease subunit [Shouchella shacheensis]
MTTILIILILLLLVTSAPIFVAFGLAAFLTVIFVTDIQPVILVQRIFGGLDQFALMALPFFIFAANIMDAGGLSDRLLRWARALVGHITGGVAMTAQVSSMFLFNIYPKKGSLTSGADGDVTIVDMEKKATIKREDLHSKSKVTAYDGFSVQGWPIQTIVRCATVMKDGEIFGEPGEGRLIRRNK